MIEWVELPYPGFERIDVGKGGASLQAIESEMLRGMDLTEHVARHYLARVQKGEVWVGRVEGRLVLAAAPMTPPGLLPLGPAQLLEITAFETHALIPPLLLLIVALLTRGNLVAVAFVAVVLLALVVWKETQWDPVNETSEPFLYDGLRDLAEYLIGTGLGLALLLLLIRLGAVP